MSWSLVGAVGSDMKPYYRILDDVHVPGRWFLTEPVDGRGANISHLLTSGRVLQLAQPVRVHLNESAQPGKPIDYCEIDGVAAPVVHARVAARLSELAPIDVQIIPVEVEGQRGSYCLVNVVRVVKCIDDQRSKEVRYFTSESGEVFRDRIGEYRSVSEMRIDPSAVGSAKIFRPWGWRVAIVVSQEIKDAFVQLGAVGAKFEEV